jgi:hypothetical protein
MLPRCAVSKFVIVNNAIPHLYPEAKRRGVLRTLCIGLAAECRSKGMLLLSLSLSVSMRLL